MSSVSLLYVLMPLLVAAFGGYRYLGNRGSASDASDLWAARRGLASAMAPVGGSTPTLELPDGSASR